MNARELALELAALERDQREKLLADLPARKRAELQRLIDEVRPLLGGAGSFGALMGEFRLRADRTAALLENPATLAQLLTAETIAVRKQVFDSFVGGDATLLTPHVHGIVAEFLQDRAQLLPDPPVQPESRKSGWRRLWK